MPSLSLLRSASAFSSKVLAGSSTIITHLFPLPAPPRPLPSQSYEYRHVRHRDMTGTPATSHEAQANPSKVCFVTIGATASFDRLLKAVLDSSFLDALQDAKYTELVIQYGKEGGKAIYDRFAATERERVHQTRGIEITGFDFDTSGLAHEMRKARGEPTSGNLEGLVISHAGQNSP